MNHVTYIDDFLALVQNKSFSAASKAQCITQPAFSRRIKMLEESLGAELFNRATHPVSLTSAGEVFLKHAEMIKDSASFAYKEVQQHISALDDPIRISTSHTLAISYLPEFLHDISPKEAMPLKLGVKHIDRCLSDLRQRQIDFALIHANKDTQIYSGNEFESIHIGDDHLVSVISPSCSNPENILAYTAETQLKRYIDTVSDSNSDMVKNTIFESSSSEVLKALCLAGHGTTIIPESLVKKELKAGELALCKEYSLKIPLKVEFLRLKSQRRNAYKEKIWRNAQNLSGT